MPSRRASDGSSSSGARPVLSRNTSTGVIHGDPAFWEQDFTEKGFQWIDCQQEEKRIYVIQRNSKKQKIIAVFNFSEQAQTYELNLEKAKYLKLLLASDNEIYGGTETYKYNEKFKVEDGIVELELTPFTGMLFEVK